MPRWWPRCVRVEDVHTRGNGKPARWISVLETDKRKVVRMDYRCRSAHQPREMVWELELDGTPFERILAESILEFGLAESGKSTKLTLTSRQKLRGFSRLGGLMMRRGTARTLSEALSGVEQALGTEP